MKAIALALLVILGLGLVFFQYHKAQQVASYEEYNYDESNDDLLGQGSFTFMADDNCELGSVYKLGLGCSSSRFENAWDVAEEAQEKPVTKIEMKHFIMTSASDIQQYMNHRANVNGGGWGMSGRLNYDMVTKLFDSVNTVSVALTDYRKHYFKSVPASRYVLPSGEVDIFVDDPVDFFSYFGYFFVSGFTTGSTFTGALNYKSENHEALTDVKISCDGGFAAGLFNVGGSYEYANKRETKHGDTDFTSSLNVTGASGDHWDKDDIKGSHDKFQDNIIKHQMLSVTISKYDSIKEIRDAMRRLSPQNRDKITAFNKIQSSFLQKISNAYGVYSILDGQVSQHIMQWGARINVEDLKTLQEYKREIENRINFIERLDNIVDLSNLRSGDDSMLQYENYSVEIERFLKQITGRTD